jgi:hypothetical protein
MAIEATTLTLLGQAQARVTDAQARGIRMTVDEALSQILSEHLAGATGSFAPELQAKIGKYPPKFSTYSLSDFPGLPQDPPVDPSLPPWRWPGEGGAFTLDAPHGTSSTIDINTSMPSAYTRQFTRHELGHLADVSPGSEYQRSGDDPRKSLEEKSSNFWNDVQRASDVPMISELLRDVRYNSPAELFAEIVARVPYIENVPLALRPYFVGVLPSEVGQTASGGI